MTGETQPLKSDLLLTFFNRVFDNSRDMINLFSLSRGSIITHNRAACDSTGYTEEDFRSIPVQNFYPPDELAKLMQAFQRLAEHGFVNVDVKMFVKSGALKDFSIRAYVIQRDPEIICLVHTIDVTEERKREERRIQEAKLATLGEASAILAHELANALHALQLNVHALERDKASTLSEYAQARIEKAKKASAHMENVIHNVRRYVARNEASSSFISLAATTQDALQMMRDYFESKGVEVKLVLTPNLPPVMANSTQVQQILLILFKNAVQAMEERLAKRLTIEANVQDNAVHLSVTDTGGGIPPAIEPQLFQAFATNKVDGGGVGLGLTIAKRLAQNNDIEISVCSKLGEGASFTLRFHAEPTHQFAANGEKLRLQGKNILVVEDNLDQLRNIVELLESQGARPLTALSAHEGIRLLALHAVDGVVCELNMYPLSGLKFAIEARTIYLGPLCFLVDRPEENNEELVQVDPGHVFVKPIVPNTFIDTLATMIEKQNDLLVG